jgi:aspartate kinase
VSKVKVGGIMAITGLAEVSIYSIPHRPDAPNIVLHTLGEKGINVEFIVHTFDIEGNGNLTFCVENKNLDLVLELLEKIKSLIEAKGLSYKNDVAIISVFGPHLRERPMISGMILNALGISGIGVLAISTSISSCSCLIQSYQVDEAMRALHETFEAPHQITKFSP